MTEGSLKADSSLNDEQIRQLADRDEKIDAMWAFLARRYGEDRLWQALQDLRDGKSADHKPE